MAEIAATPGPPREPALPALPPGESTAPSRRRRARKGPGRRPASGPGTLPRRLGRGFLMVIRTLRTNPLSLAGFVIVVILVIAAVVIWFDPGILPYAPLSADYSAGGQGPSWAHPCGTDTLGRDICVNVAAALPTDLAIGVMIAGASLLFGGTLGVVAGYYNRPRSLGEVSSTVILRVTDLFLAFPALLLALAFVVALGHGLYQVVLAVFLTWWPYYVRLARGEVLTVKNQLYISAARAAGVPERRIVVRHVLRNILEPLLVYFTLDVGTVIVTFSTVAFVTGALPYPFASTIEWGAMISFYEPLVTTQPWTILFPSLAILVTVLAFSLLGDGLRDILDPRSRRVIVQAAVVSRVGMGGLTPLSNPDEDAEMSVEESPS